MSLIYRYLFDRELYPRLSPSQRAVVRGRKPKPKTLPGPPPPGTRRQLLLFIETAGGVLVPAFPAGPKRPGRKPKVKLKKSAKIPRDQKSKKANRLEVLANKDYDKLTPAQQRELDEFFQPQIAERKQQVQRTWTEEEEKERNMVPAVPVEWNPTIVKDGDF